jgi:hypothetical protein
MSRYLGTLMRRYVRLLQREPPERLAAAGYERMTSTIRVHNGQPWPWIFFFSFDASLSYPATIYRIIWHIVPPYVARAGQMPSLRGGTIVVVVVCSLRPEALKPKGP